MGIFGLIVVTTIVWWLIFFMSLPFGVERGRDLEPGHDPGAPQRPMLWRKALVTTLITAVIVGGIWLADHEGWVDFRSLIQGEAV